MKALVVGTGTSLDRYDVQYAATKVDLTIAINNAIMMLPNADICYSGSSRWWNYHGPFIDWYKGEGFSHFFGEHPEALQDESSVEEWIQELNEVAPVLDALGVEVINCTPKSMLKCFKKLTLGGALP